MIIESISDQGTAERREDGFIVNPPFFGVVDGFSAPYSPQHPPILFDGESGGEIIRRLTLEVFYSITPDWPLEDALILANRNIDQFFAENGVVDRLAGASFVFLKIEKGKINIIQGGDCMAVWSFASGKFGITKNQAYGHVSKNLKTIAELMEKHKSDRGKMWDEFAPILATRRQQDTNNRKSKDCFAVLNGQMSAAKCWQEITIPTASLDLIVLFSDGFVSYAETIPQAESARILSERIITEYKNTGLSTILDKKRKREAKNATSSYITHDEATAIAIKF